MIGRLSGSFKIFQRASALTAGQYLAVVLSVATIMMVDFWCRFEHE